MVLIKFGYCCLFEDLIMDRHLIRDTLKLVKVILKVSICLKSVMKRKHHFSCCLKLISLNAMASERKAYTLSERFDVYYYKMC